MTKVTNPKAKELHLTNWTRARDAKNGIKDKKNIIRGQQDWRSSEAIFPNLFNFHY